MLSVEEIRERLEPLYAEAGLRMQGSPLYEKSEGEFRRFFSLAFRMYVDTKKLREVREGLINNFIQKREIS